MVTINYFNSYFYLSILKNIIAIEYKTFGESHMALALSFWYSLLSPFFSGNIDKLQIKVLLKYILYN
nr:MAG TPA: hypothetical protein [Caudoviricetes sp.]